MDSYRNLPDWPRAHGGAVVHGQIRVRNSDFEVSEDLGFDFAPLFTDSGDLAPGSEGDLRLILERLLEIKKKSQGTIRKDAPVQPDQSPLPSSREAPGSSPAGTR